MYDASATCLITHFVRRVFVQPCSWVHNVSAPSKGCAAGAPGINIHIVLTP